MFDSEILEVTIGVVFVFVLVSTIASAIREGIEAWLKTRASYLEFGIRELLQDKNGTGISAELFKHPLIQNLFSGDYVPRPASQSPPKQGGNLPSYIPSRNFAAAIMDIAARGPTSVDGEPRRLSVAELRAAIASKKDLRIRGALLAAIDGAGDDLEQARLNVEAWYDSTMDRVSGWYKRSTQWFLFWIALGTAITLNIDTLQIIDHLYSNDTQRSALLATIEKTTTPPATYEDARQDLQALKLPIGWQQEPPQSAGDWLSKFCGWLVVAIAAMLGAPFWFDLLNKIMVIRSTVKPREKSREEGSEDRQAPQAAIHRHTLLSATQTPVAGTATETTTTTAPANGAPDAHCEIGDVSPTPDEVLPAAEGGVRQ
jgi:hypothetical protein